MANNITPRRRGSPVAALFMLLVTSVGSIAAIGLSAGVVAAVVSETASASVPATGGREAWYAPADAAGRMALSADDLDIARFVPVTPRAATIAAAPVATASTDLQPSAAAEAGTHRVNTEMLRVRAAPSRGAAQVFALKGGTPVVAGRNDRGWIEITAPDGRTGWVYEKFLTPLRG